MSISTSTKPGSDQDICKIRCMLIRPWCKHKRSSVISNGYESFVLILERKFRTQQMQHRILEDARNGKNNSGRPFQLSKWFNVTLGDHQSHRISLWAVSVDVEPFQFLTPNSPWANGSLPLLLRTDTPSGWIFVSGATLIAGRDGSSMLRSWKCERRKVTVVPTRTSSKITPARSRLGCCLRLCNLQLAMTWSSNYHQYDHPSP